MRSQTSEKILIVDDEHEIARALGLYLEDAGYAPALVFDGSAALDALIFEKDYTVVLLDINMPGLDGVTVLKRLQAAECDTAVIMMTGRGNENLAVECMKNGAEDYISKPFAFEDMLQRVERAQAHRRERIEKRQLQREKEDFILMLSHDLKNPLTAVIGSIDIVKEGCLGTVNEEQGEYLQSAIDSCNEVVTMIDNLLDIRKFEAGKIHMATHQHNIIELVTKVANQFARPAKHDGIEFVTDLETESLLVEVDKNAFIRVVGNLLGNALKFTHEGGTITVNCHRFRGDRPCLLDIPAYITLPPDFLNNTCIVRLSVSNTGNGIPLDELEHIFDRFTQLSRKNGRERSGAGLGLTYCKLAVERFNGVIWVESKEQQSEFVILLPCSSNNHT
ncbi:MAG: response regulator [Desulfuromonadaceae bacterium]|nr:response regulator [Desulfuromonadaceae bacterium]